MDRAEEPPGVRRFNPLRSVRRGLKAACCWTIRLGRGRTRAAPGLARAGRRAGRGRRGAPPLASLSAAILEPDEMMGLVEEQPMPSKGHLQVGLPLVSAVSSLEITAAPGVDSGGSSFPLVLRRPAYESVAGFPDPHNHQRRVLHYHTRADNNELYNYHPHHHHHHHHNHQREDRQHHFHDEHPHHHHHHHHQPGEETDEAGWMHHHDRSGRRSNCLCTCSDVATGLGCSGQCHLGDHPQHPHSSSASPASPPSAAYTSGSRGADMLTLTQGQDRGHSLQHLLAVGSRQWGSGGWWDGRGLLRVKIYDFAIYADGAKAAHALQSAAVGSSLRPVAGKGRGGGAGASTGGSTASPAAPAQMLVSPASRVDMSLTIRACRNLPLDMLSEEFERILQRRHEKAGGRADDPALRELLSYFSRDRLPEHVVVTAPGGGAGSGSRGDAVKKGAAITFSRSASGALVTEAGGQVLGRVDSPALAEALFDLYLGDQPVSKRAKAAAGAALLDMAAGRGGGYRYRLQPGERLLCGPGARGPQDADACVLQMP